MTTATPTDPAPVSDPDWSRRQRKKMIAVRAVALLDVVAVVLLLGCAPTTLDPTLRPTTGSPAPT
jgi:hypothetical protein